MLYKCEKGVSKVLDVATDKLLQSVLIFNHLSSISLLSAIFFSLRVISSSKYKATKENRKLRERV